MSGPLAIAAAAWGEPLPDWIAALASACETSSQRAVAERLGRSAGLVSQVLRCKYPGDMAAVEEAVRGAYMAATVDCPALGALPTDQCQVWQGRARAFANLNSLRVRMFRACNACPRYRRGGGGHG